MIKTAHTVRSGLVAAVALVLGLAALIGSTGAAWAQSHVHTHYQKNMAFGNNAERRLATDILDRLPDAVTLQEVNRDNDKLLDMLHYVYPSQKFCYFNGIGGVAVLSRWPLVPGTAHCIGNQGASAMQVRMPDGPVWVVSIHLETRDKPRHASQADRLAVSLKGLGGPMILGGDFNDMPQSGPVRSIARTAGVNRIGKAISTYRVGGVFGIPIDFVFATGGRGSVDQLPLIGSDHYGLWAEFTMPR